MISEISLTVIAVAAIVLAFGFICIGSIFCCCALSSPSIFGSLLCCGGFSLLFRKPDRRSDSHSNNGSQIYQNRGFINSNAYNEAYNSSSQAFSQHDDILLAEAYLVAPLVEARVLNENVPSTDGILSNKRNFESEGDGATIRSGEMEQRRPPMIFKDIWAAAIFIIQVIVIIYFAVQVSLKSMKVTDPNYKQLNGLGILVAAFGVLGALATLMGTLCLTFVLRNSNYIIEGVMWMNISVCAVGSVLCLASGSIVFAGILGILAAVNYWYLNSVRNRIAFASAVLSVACQAIKDNYTGTIIAAYILLAAQLGWFVLWSIASYGIGIQFLVVDDNGSQLDDKGKTKDVQFTGGQFGVLFLMLLSLHWGSEVVRSLLQTTVNGVIACWWFQPLRKAIVRGALFRSVTTSFGSVCFGSFIVSTIHALRDLLKLFSNNRDENNRSRRGTDLGDLLAKSAECILGLVEQALTYFNKYAYCYVAGYGMGFIESAQKVTKLFIEKGWTAIINDNLISNALTFAVLGMTVVTALLGTFSSLFLGSYLEKVGITESMILLSVVGALMGFAVSVVLTNALSSGVAMVFVCMAENPDALKDNHPDEYHALTSAWSAFHPQNDWSPSNVALPSREYYNNASNQQQHYRQQQPHQQQLQNQTNQYPQAHNTGATYPYPYPNNQIVAPYPHNWNPNGAGAGYADSLGYRSGGHDHGNNRGGGGEGGGGYDYQRSSRAYDGAGDPYGVRPPHFDHQTNVNNRSQGGLIEARLVSDSTTYSPMQQHVQLPPDPYGYGYQAPNENVQQPSIQHVPHAHYHTPSVPLQGSRTSNPSAPPPPMV